MNPGSQTLPNYDDRLIQVKEVIRLTSVSRTQLHRLVKAGSFPRPCKIGAARKAWSLQEVRLWIADRRAEAHALSVLSVDADAAISLPWEN